MSFAGLIALWSAALQAQDPVLQGADAAARRARPILFEGLGGLRLYEAGRKQDRGGKDRVVFAADAPLGQACLSASGTMLAVGSHAGGQRRIWLSDLEGNARPVTQDQAPDSLGEIAFSADGRYVAYQLRGHTLGDDSLHVLDLKTATQRRLTPDGMATLYFCWSPDSSKLAVGMVLEVKEDTYGDMVQVHRRMEVVILDAASGEVTQLTHAGEEIRELAWSPDGKWIAYKAAGKLKLVATEPSRRTEETADEDHETRVLLTGVTAEGAPRWAPDSSAVAVVRHAERSGPFTPPGSAERSPPRDKIIVVPLEGEPAIYEFDVQLWYFDFSPAGDALAVTAADKHLTLLNLKTDERTVLVPEVGFWSHVSWASAR